MPDEVLAGALREVGLTAATTVDSSRELLDQVVGPDAEVLRGGVGGDRVGHGVFVAFGDQRDHRRVVAEFPTNVADQGAQVGGRHPGRHPLRHHPDVTDALRPRGGIGRCGPRVGQPVAFDFFFRGFQPLDQVRHSGGHLFGRHLQRRGQAGHQRPLLGQVLE